MTKTPKKPKSTTKTAPNTKHIEYKKLESLCRSQHKFIVSLEKKAEATDKKTKSIHNRWTHEEITTAYLQETFGQIPMRKFREYNIKTMDKKIKKKIN